MTTQTAASIIPASIQHSRNAAVKQKTFYMMLKPYVLPFVSHYTTDFTEHDKRFFRKNPNGRFLFGMRNTGTDIVNLDKKVWVYASGDTVKVGNENVNLDSISPEAQKQIDKESCILWLTTYNQRFFVGRTSATGCRTLTEVSREYCIDIINGM